MSLSAVLSSLSVKEELPAAQLFPFPTQLLGQGKYSYRYQGLLLIKTNLVFILALSGSNISSIKISLLPLSISLTSPCKICPTTSSLHWWPLSTVANLMYCLWRWPLTITGDGKLIVHTLKVEFHTISKYGNNNNNKFLLPIHPDSHSGFVQRSAKKSFCCNFFILESLSAAKSLCFS